MSITQNNVADFITFLFKKRKGQEPPAQLLDGWRALSNDEIAAQLNGLFQSWGLTEEDKRMEINAFFKETLFTTRPVQQQPSRNPPIVIQPQQPAVVPFAITKKKKK